MTGDFANTGLTGHGSGYSLVEREGLTLIPCDLCRQPAIGRHSGVTQEESTPTQTPHGHIINNLPPTPGARLRVY